MFNLNNFKHNLNVLIRQQVYNIKFNILIIKDIVVI